MKKNTYRFGSILLLAIAALLTGCTEKPTPSTVINPIKVDWKQDITAADIGRIKWLEGTWRGTGEGQEPFFERYRFEDTVMYVETFADGKLETVSDTARYALVNGEFRQTKDGRRTAVSEITDDHVQFIPVVGDGNRFRFERQPGGKWRAVLDVPATADSPAKQVIYMMEPYSKK